MQVTVLVDNDSWILPYAKAFINSLKDRGIKAKLLRDQDEIETNNDVCFLVGCTKIVTEENLNKSRYNFVVHESDLPKGKGFAPMSWQILEGVDNIVISLIDASKEVDSGEIWLQDRLILNGTELHNEWREMQARKTFELCEKLISYFDEIQPVAQCGEDSYYQRRRPKDSELDIDKSIRESFNLLRVVDNEKYPAFFLYEWKKVYTEDI
jgi:methionyl-tRNA formyltransferase